jgi:hypothetical protein
MRKISVSPAFKHQLQSISGHWQVAARWSLPWLVLAAALNAWALLTTKSNPDLEINIGNAGVESILMLVGFLGSSSIAVSWHRYILNDEPSATVSPFRLDKIVWAYITRSIGIGLICIIPMVAISVIIQFLPSIFLPIWVVASLFLLVIMTRLSVSLVATAIGREGITFKTSLLATRGNDLQILSLVLLTLFVMVAAMMVFIVIASFAQVISPKLALPASVLFGILLQFVLILLNTSLQTSLYGFFIENREF